MIAAIFDVDGTLLAGDSMEAHFLKFLWRGGELRPRDLARLAMGAGQAAMEGRSMLRTNKAYLAGKDAQHFGHLARDCFGQQIERQLLPRAVERVRWHQAQGHCAVLISGSLELLLAPLAAYLQVRCFAGTGVERLGDRLAGRIAGTHPYAVGKVSVLMDLQERCRFDLARSFAYGNHYTDRHLLAAVGHPVATNPDRRLRRFALHQGWLIEDFERSSPHRL